MSKIKKQAIDFADEKLNNGESSDGCTLAPDFNFSKCCRRHDIMIRYTGADIKPRDADRYLRECIIEHGHPVKAWVYWTFVRVSNIVGGFQNLIALFIIGLVLWWGY